MGVGVGEVVRKDKVIRKLALSLSLPSNSSNPSLPGTGDGDVTYIFGPFVICKTFPRLLLPANTEKPVYSNLFTPSTPCSIFLPLRVPPTVSPLPKYTKVQPWFVFLLLHGTVLTTGPVNAGLIAELLPGTYNANFDVMALTRNYLGKSHCFFFFFACIFFSLFVSVACLFVCFFLLSRWF